MFERKIPITEAIRSLKVKTYGNINLDGIEGDTLFVTGKTGDTITIMQTGDVIFITAMDRCDLKVPANLEVTIEKALGSLHINSLQSPLQCEKVLGNVVISGASTARIEKIGGNCSIKNISGEAIIEKIGGNFVADSFSNLVIEKIGGNCLLRNGSQTLNINKVGGQLSGEGLDGSVTIQRIGGNLTCNNLSFGADTKIGGDAHFGLFGIPAKTSISVGGDIRMHISADLTNVKFLLSYDGILDFNVGGVIVNKNGKGFEQVLGNGEAIIEVRAGGNIIITDEPWVTRDLADDIKAHFNTSTASFSETIHEQVRRASEMAASRISEAQKRLDEIQSQIGSDISEHVDMVIGASVLSSETQAPQAQKSVTDEERLLILQMLQDKKITVDEAEQLFRSLEKNK